MTPWSHRPVVYRCYDQAGDLLYIGSSVDVERRIEAHHRSSFWASRIRRVRIQIAPDEVAARRIEAESIRAENPRFNLNHRRPQSQWAEQDYVDVISVLRRGSSRHTTHTARRIRRLRQQLRAYRSGAAS